MDEKRWPVPYWDIDTGMAALLALLIAIGYAKPHDRPSPSLKRGHRPAEQVIHKGNC